MKMIRITLSEWSTINPVSGSQTYQVHLTCDPSQKEMIAGLAKSRMVEITDLVDGLRIKSFWYVGLVEIGNIQICIKPKIKGFPLFNLINYAYNFMDTFHFKSTYLHRFEENLFHDIVIIKFLSELEELFQRGLKRNYIEQNHYEGFLKGKIKFNDIVKKGGITTPRISCSFFSHSDNFLINQVLLAGIILAYSITENKILKNHLQTYKNLLEETVLPVPLSDNLFLKVHRNMNRLTNSYNSIIRLIELLFESKSISFEGVKENLLLPGFLFNMNNFFQRLLSRFLKDNIKNYWVKEERSLKNLMYYKKEFNPRKKNSPKLKPDFIIGKDSTIFSIIDTKYRDLWHKSLPREMLYQVAVYALLGGKRNNAIIIYPTVHDDAGKQVIRMEHIESEKTSGTITLKPINLLLLEQMIKNCRDNGDFKTLQEYADYLAFD